MMISKRRESSWLNPDIFPAAEVRLSNAPLNEEVMVTSDDKHLADWLFADEDLAVRVRAFVPKGNIWIDAKSIQVIRSPGR